MIRSYLKIFLRSFQKNATFSLINVLGLTLGMTCFTVILLFGELEFSYDNFHQRPDCLLRVVKDFVSNEGMRVPDATTPPALAPAIRAELPEAESVTRFFSNGGRRNLLEYKDKRFYEMSLLRIDSSFFKVFDFQFSKGNKDKPFNGIHSILLTETTAQKYFGNEDPIGKIIRTNINNQTDFEVTGVLKDVPANSHFSFNVLIPFESTRNPDIDWDRHTAYTYVKLRSPNDETVLESHIRELVKRHAPEKLDEYYVQPITDIHLASRLKSELGENGDLQYVNILMFIGIFVLVVAGINYVNIVTAQSARRAKEIGVRKVTGALRNSLMLQFMVESISMALMSFVLTIVVTIVLLQFSHQFFGKDLSEAIYSSHWVRTILPVCVLMIGIFSGAYPAFYLSSVRPLQVLRGKLFGTSHGIRLRQGLVIFQFIVSGVLITGFLVIDHQLDFIRNKNLGFDQQQILTVANVIGVENPEAVAEDFGKIANVQRVARASGGILGLANSINGIADKNEENHISLNFLRTDYDFIPTLGMQIVDGRNFSNEFRSDSSGIILNETAVAQLRLKQPIVGQTLKWDDQAGATQDVHVVGVVKDFHFTSFHESIHPFGFILEVNNGSTFFLKIASDDIAGTLSQVEKVWTKHNPDKPLDYSFQDEYYARLHASEARFQKLFSSFTFLAIVIACLGLFGLVTAMANSKTKEIGIRKVFGSSVTAIVGMLSKEFIQLVVIAFILAAPLAFWIVKAWLEGFAYRVPIRWQDFAWAGVITILIAVSTISFKSIKAALANPIKSLRDE